MTRGTWLRPQGCVEEEEEYDEDAQAVEEEKEDMSGENEEHEEVMTGK